MAICSAGGLVIGGVAGRGISKNAINTAKDLEHNLKKLNEAQDRAKRDDPHKPCPPALNLMETGGHSTKHDIDEQRQQLLGDHYDLELSERQKTWRDMQRAALGSEEQSQG